MTARVRGMGWERQPTSYYACSPPLPQTNRSKSVARARPQTRPPADTTMVVYAHWPSWLRWLADRSISRLVVVEEKPKSGPAHQPTERPTAPRSLISASDAWTSPADGSLIRHGIPLGQSATYGSGTIVLFKMSFSS